MSEDALHFPSCLDNSLIWHSILDGIHCPLKLWSNCFGTPLLTASSFLSFGRGDVASTTLDAFPFQCVFFGTWDLIIPDSLSTVIHGHFLCLLMVVFPDLHRSFSPTSLSPTWVPWAAVWSCVVFRTAVMFIPLLSQACL